MIYLSPPQENHIGRDCRNDSATEFAPWSEDLGCEDDQAEWANDFINAPEHDEIR